MLEMGFPRDKIQWLDEQINQLGEEAKLNMKEETHNKLELLRKVEMKFNDLKDQREMAVHFGAEDVVNKEENRRRKALKEKKQILQKELEQ